MRAAGRQLADLREPSWQRQVLYIPQDPYLFHATLRDNIVLYRPDADDDEVACAVEVVGLGDLVAELPDGLDTLVGEGARALSGGQAPVSYTHLPRWTMRWRATSRRPCRTAP